MAYEGEVINQCSTHEINLSTVAVVAVSGTGPNVCGHLLVSGRIKGAPVYFHVAGGFYTQPKFMLDSGFARYLKENKKTEIRRLYVDLPKPHDAKDYLCNLMAKDWAWLVLPNNCVAFVEEVIKAGGAKWASVSNCPALATAPSIQQNVGRFLVQLEGQLLAKSGVVIR
jgi:hypothetical protein